MAGPEQTNHEQWSSELAFILAALGSAVGLGNIWRFPYIVGENGGGAFVIIYLLAVVGLGLPALIATIIIGRHGQSSPIECFSRIAAELHLARHWVWLGWLLVLSAYLLLTFFSVVASWTFEYLVIAFTGGFQDLSAETSAQLFDHLKADPLRLSLWHGLFMGLTLYVVGKGIKRGIERAIKIIMPLLFLLLLFLLVYACVAGNVMAAVEFLFYPDFSRIDAHAILLAVGQAFLSLSVGGAGMLVYGAYLRKQASIPRSGVIITGVDTLVALMTGLIIFPVVFAHGLEPAGGPGLIFVTLPIAFGKMPGGVIFAIVFFVLLLLAALSSAFSMFEPVVAWLEENRGISRKVAALLAGSLGWAIGLATVFSFNIWSEIRPLEIIDRFSDMNVFRVLEYLVTGVAMPAGTLLVAVFVGWIVTEQLRRQEYSAGGGKLYNLWRILLRFLVPVSLLVLFVINL